MLPRLVVAAFAMSLASCASTAPHSLGAAAINTALATGASAGTRAAGGCYATCTNGTTCNPRTGLCDRIITEVTAEPTDRDRNRMTLQLQQQGAAAAQFGPAIIGISPATGSVPPPPAEASPRPP